MKHKLLLILALFIPTLAIADPVEITRTKNVLSDVWFGLYNSGSNTLITGATGNFTCKTCSYAEGSTCNPTTTCGGSITEDTGTGAYNLPMQASEINNDYAKYLLTNSAAGAITLAWLVKTKPSGVNVLQVGGFSVTSGIAQASTPSPTGSSFLLAAGDTNSYRPGQGVCMAYTTAPNNECSVITGCSSGTCSVSPAFSVNVPAGAVYTVGTATANLDGPTKELSGPPTATDTFRNFLEFLFMSGRDQVVQNKGANTLTQDNDSGSPVWVKTVTPGSVFTLGKAH